MKYIDNIILFIAKFKWYRMSMTYWAFINSFIAMATSGIIFDIIVILSFLINITCSLRLISLGGWWWTIYED